MNTGMISVRYAKALLEFAYEKKCAEKVYGEMANVARSYEQETSLRRILDNPILPDRTKAEVIRNAGGGNTSVHNKRERYMQQISLMYLDLYRKLNHISTGKLETAVAIDSETEKRISDWIAAKTRGTVELRTCVKPELIGGFIFEMDSERLDASIATQLRSIKKQFVEKNKRIV